MDRLIGLLSSAISCYDWKWLSALALRVLPPTLFLSCGTGTYWLIELKSILSKEYSLMMRPVIGVNIMPFILFVFFAVWASNFFGLFPYVPTPTRNIVLVFRFTLTLWVTMLTCWALTSFGLFLSHLVPSGAPQGIIFALVAIELISNLIRPITLAVRLSANMLAGHMLIAVVNRYLRLSPAVVFVVSFAVFIVVLEMCVAVIQAYVITSLSVLFLRESFSCLKY